jgi:hypothetical protein
MRATSASRIWWESVCRGKRELVSLRCSRRHDADLDLPVAVLVEPQQRLCPEDNVFGGADRLHQFLEALGTLIALEPRVLIPRCKTEMSIGLRHSPGSHSPQLSVGGFHSLPTCC